MAMVARATKVSVPPDARRRLGRAPPRGRVPALETAPDRRRARLYPAPLARPAERSLEGSTAPGRDPGADWNRAAAAGPARLAGVGGGARVAGRDRLPAPDAGDAWPGGLSGAPSRVAGRPSAGGAGELLHQCRRAHGAGEGARAG